MDAPNSSSFCEIRERSATLFSTCIVWLLSWCIFHILILYLSKVKYCLLFADFITMVFVFVCDLSHHTWQWCQDMVDQGTFKTVFTDCNELSRSVENVEMWKMGDYENGTLLIADKTGCVSSIILKCWHFSRGPSGLQKLVIPGNGQMTKTSYLNYQMVQCPFLKDRRVNLAHWDPFASFHQPTLEVSTFWIQCC